MIPDTITRRVLMSCGHASTITYKRTSAFAVIPRETEVKCSECGRLGFAVGATPIKRKKRPS